MTDAIVPPRPNHPPFYTNRGLPKIMPEIVPTKPQEELAKEYKAELTQSAKALFDVMDRIKRDGFEIQFSIGDVPPFGKKGFQALKIIKEF